MALSAPGATGQDSAGALRSLLLNSDGSLKPERATSGAPVGVTVSTSAVQILAANTSARSRLVVNCGTSTIYLGSSAAVTASGSAMGAQLRPGGSSSDSGDGLYNGAIFGIGDAAASTQNVSVWERA